MSKREMSKNAGGLMRDKAAQDRHRRRLLVYGLLWLLLMGLIFAMSSQNGEESSELSNGFLRYLFGWLIPLVGEQTASLLIRKGAHMGEYACLALLTLRFAAELLWDRAGRLKIALPCAFGWSVFYACTDELHQRFVSGRAGQFRDVLIDSSGALLGLLLAALLLRLWKKRNNA